MAYYIVTDNQTKNGEKPKQHLVSAKNKGAALSAIVEPRFSVVVAEDTDLIELTKSGVEVVNA